MTEAVKEPAADRWAKRRKYWLQLVLGAVSGAAGMMAVLWLLERQELPDPDVSMIVAAGVAVIYILMGVLVGLGTLFPGAGAKLLNVQDREELLEQRAMLLGSAVGCGLFGAVMLTLVFAMSGISPIGPQTAFWLFVGALVVTSVITWRQWPLYDELMRAVVQESAALFGYGLLVVLALWGAAAASGLIGGPAPLDLVSLAFGGFLVACYVVISRRGMMQLD